MRKLLNYVSSVLVVLLIGLFVGVLIGRSQGRAAFIVLSGSMEPAYPVGGLVFTKPTSFTQLTTGDAITFQTQGAKIVTHRILEINQKEGFARTKGDANKTPDGQVVLAKNVIGEVVFCLPYVGYGIAFLQSSLGKWLLLMVVLSLLMHYVIRIFFRQEQSATTEVSASDGRR